MEELEYYREAKAAGTLFILPVAIGETIYRINRNQFLKVPRIEEVEVVGISFGKGKGLIKNEISVWISPNINSYTTISLEDWGRYAFKTREEAEEAIIGIKVEKYSKKQEGFI